MCLITSVCLITTFSVYSRTILLYAGTRQCEHECQGDVAHGDTRSRHSLEGVLHGHHVYKCIYGLPPLMNGFLFVSKCGMRTNRIILCCFGDKRCEMVGHIPRINCSAMIAVLM